MKNNTVYIWCDGGARKNGDPNSIGGWGVLLKYRDNVKELCGAEKGVTNNQMELRAIIEALNALKTTNIPVEVHADSAYVVNGINNWVKGWKKKGWRKSDGKVIENLELWKQLDKLVSLQEDITISKVKGHADNEGNNIADALVNKAMDEMEE